MSISYILLFIFTFNLLHYSSLLTGIHMYFIKFNLSFIFFRLFSSPFIWWFLFVLWVSLLLSTSLFIFLIHTTHLHWFLLITSYLIPYILFLFIFLINFINLINFLLLLSLFFIRSHLLLLNSTMFIILFIFINDS